MKVTRHIQSVVILCGLSLLSLTCCIFKPCGDDSLTDFVNHIIRGYTPFQRLYVRDQMRIGFTRVSSSEFSFNRFMTGDISSDYATDRSVSYALRTEEVANLSANVKAIISAGLDYASVDTLKVTARGIKVFSFPNSYSICLNNADPGFVENGEIITAIARIDTLFIDVVYKSQWSTTAKLDSEIGKVQAGLDVHATTARSFTITYVQRPIAYLSEKVRPANIEVAPEKIVLWGKVSGLSDTDRVTVQVKYSDGKYPLSAPLDAYQRYSIAVPVKALDSILIKRRDGPVLYRQPFVPDKSDYQYDFPR